MNTSVIFSKKKKTDKAGYLYVLYTNGKKRKKVSLEFTTTLEIFNKYYDKGWLGFRKNPYFDHSIINGKIDELKNKDVFKLVKKKESTYLSYFKFATSQLNNKSTVKTYETAYKAFDGYLQSIDRNDMDFKDINYDFIVDLEKHLINKGLEKSSIKFYFNTFSTIYNKASKSEVYMGANPFHTLKIKRGIGKPKNPLTNNDISIISNIRKGQRYWIESRMFMFCYFGNGMRVGDMMMMKIGNIERDIITYKQMKVEHPIKLTYTYELFEIIFSVLGLDEWFYSKLAIGSNRIIGSIYQSMGKSQFFPDELTEEDNFWLNFEKACKKKLLNHIKELDKNELIFKGYFDKPDIFKSYNKNIPMNEEQFMEYKRKLASYNVKLKRMAKFYKLSNEKITTHTARVTVTNILLDMDEMNINDIRVALGHNNITTTQKYIKEGFDFKKSDKLAKRLGDFAKPN